MAYIHWLAALQTPPAKTSDVFVSGNGGLLCAIANLVTSCDNNFDKDSQLELNVLIPSSTLSAGSRFDSILDDSKYRFYSYSICGYNVYFFLPFAFPRLESKTSQLLMTSSNTSFEFSILL